MTDTQVRLAICAILVLILGGVRSVRTGALLKNNHFVEIAWAVAGSVLTVGLLVEAYVNPDLVDIIGPDGIVALMVGAGTQILSAFSDEIRSDFVFIWTKIKKLLNL